MSNKTTQVSGILDGNTFEYSDWKEGTFLLDFLMEKGLKPQHSCRAGSCAACAFRVVDGEVDMIKNESLDPDDVADGIRLACQTVAASERLEVSFDG